MADESKPHAEIKQAESHTSDADSDTDENAKPAGGVRHVLVVLSNKWVLISGVGGVLLAITGTALFMLMQSVQEKDQLQAELHKTQKKLEQTTAARKPEVSARILAPAPAPTQESDPVVEKVSQVDSKHRPVVDAGECLLTDKASVAQNLKNCIESFNRATDRSRTAR